MIAKQDQVLTLLMYLFKHHMERDYELDIEDIDIEDELLEVGFHPTTIEKTRQWLENLQDLEDNPPQPASEYAFRVFDAVECACLDTQSRGFILLLEQHNIIDYVLRELILNQLTLLSIRNIDMGLIKWVTLMVLLNQRGPAEVLNYMEFLVCNDFAGGNE